MAILEQIHHDSFKEAGYSIEVKIIAKPSPGF